MSISTIRFSPEIEVEFDPDDVETCDLLDGCDPCEDCGGDDCDNCNKDGNVELDLIDFSISGWEITEDCSLDNGLEYKPASGHHLYYNKKTMAEIKKLLTLIKKKGGYTNVSCGLHIHVDVSKYTDEQIANIIRLFAINQEKIISKFKVVKYRLDQYCRPLPTQLQGITTKNVAEFRREHKDTFWRQDDKKYYALNMECVYRGGYNTLEFRLFNGTVNYDTLHSYIRWVLNFVNKAKDGVNEDIQI